MTGIAYQNKDITSKVFAERFQGKAFRVYGIDMPEIKQALPTNLPSITANELKMDNIFLLADGKIAIIDYESEYRSKNLHKYIDYINKVLLRYEREWGRHIDVRMIVIYTGEVRRNESRDLYDVGCLRLELESAYLSEIDKDGIRDRLRSKIARDEALTDEEMMQFILLPLAYKGVEKKNEIISGNVEAVKEMQDAETKAFLLTGLVAFCDKIIDPQNRGKIRRMMEMTQVGQMFVDEIEEAVKENSRIVEEENRERVKRNLKSRHPEWTESMIAEEAAALFE